MRSCFEAIGRLVGTVLVLVVLGFVLSFLGCSDSSGPWQPAPDYYVPSDPPGLTDPPLSAPSYDIPPPDLQPPPPVVQAVEPAPIPAVPIPLDPGPP